MADNLGLRGQPDRSLINIHQQWEVDYWCKQLNCTESELKAAVKAVGNWVVNVRKYLAELRLSKPGLIGSIIRSPGLLG